MLRRSTAVLAAALLFAIGASAQAFATNVLVMDTDRVLNGSEVGQHIRDRLNEIGEEITTELQTEESGVRGDVEQFQSETADKTEEQIAGDADLAARRTDLQTRVNQLGISEQVKQRELAATRNAALEPVHTALSEVLEEIVEEKSADILIERSSVIFVNEATDVTDEVIDKLNAKITTVPVERVRLPVAEDDSSGSGDE